MPSDESERIALTHLKGKKAELTEHQVNLRLDVSHAKFPPIPDDRFPLEDRPLDWDFQIAQVAFFDAFNSKYARPDAGRLELEIVECRYSHDVEFGQITPVFRMKWVVKGTSDNRTIKSVGFGKRFNGLGITEEKKRELTIESAAVAYQEAVLRCVLESLKQ